MAKTKPAKYKAVTVKPVKIHPTRGAGGKFVSKATLTGKSKIKKFFDVLQSSVVEVGRSEVRSIAEKAAEGIRQSIKGQNVTPMGGRRFGKSRRFDQPLNEFTLKRKLKEGQDERILIATGFYVNHIGVVEIKKGKGYTYRVGFTATMHPGGLPMNVLGRVLEYGSRIRVTPKMRAYLHWRGLHLKATTKFIIIPSRPHFGPAYLKLRREIARVKKWSSKKMVDALKQKLKIP